jgi:hypothetical protein
LVSPVTTGTPAPPCRVRHRVHDALEVGEGKAFLQNEAAGEIERSGARHRHVVEGAVDRQATDVAAGKRTAGENDVAVGRHHQPAGGNGELGVIVLRPQPVVVERGQKQFLDQLRHRPAATAVAHFDATVRQIETAGEDFAATIHDAAA